MEAGRRMKIRNTDFQQFVGGVTDSECSGIILADFGMSESDVEEMIQDAVGEKVGELYTTDSSKEEVRLNVKVVAE
jgi:hypothetical protein